jgi:hypothetical protein
MLRSSSVPIFLLAAVRVSTMTGPISGPLASARGQSPETDPDRRSDEPLDLDVVEKVERRLTQLDLSLRRKRRANARQTADQPTGGPGAGDRPVDTQRPYYLMSVVCRGKRERRDPQKQGSPR